MTLARPAVMSRRTERVTVRAKALRRGDYLLGSRQTVLAAEWHPGWERVRLTLLTSRGTERSPSFNARTTITIERETHR